VLVLRALGLGDLLTGVPALRGVRRGLPGHRLQLATDPGLAEVVDLIEVVDELVPARGLEPLAYEGSPEFAVDLHGRGPESHRLLRVLDPRHLVAFADAESGVEGQRWCQDEHEVDRWCRLVNHAFGPVADPADLRLAAGRGAPGVPAGAAVVHPGAAYQARRWPPERFAAVARRLADQGLSVLVTGSGPERLLARRVAAAAGLGDAAVLAGKTSPGVLASLVGEAALVVTGDTGTAHLASAFGTPSVVLFGPTPPAHWGPPVWGPHVALWHGDRPGDPWSDTTDAALLQITVEEVWEAARELLSRVAH
jgi:ADP-heptose:LPS heptosyltransferase